MITKIAAAAGEIWLELDRAGGTGLTELLRRLERPERPGDFLWMALGWLIYAGHVKCVPAENGGRLFLVSPNVKEGLRNEKSNQNSFAPHGA